MIAIKAIVSTLFNVILGQCSDMMKSKVKGNKKFKDIETDGKVAELLKLIRSASREVNTNASVYDTIDESKRRYYLYRQ